MAVEIINPGVGGRRPAGAARPVLRQEPPRAVPERGLVLLPIAEVLSCRAAGAVLLDCREPAEFTAGHVRGAVSVGLRGEFEKCAGAVLPPDRDVVLVGDVGIAAEATARLGRAGYEGVVGQLDDLASGALMLDVREPDEWRAGHVAQAWLLPMGQLARHRSDLPRDRRIVVACRSGGRSAAVAEALRAWGFEAVNLSGGMSAWAAAGLPAVMPGPDITGLVVHRTRPLNCETSIPALIGGVVMPNARFYVRNHFQTPRLDPASWQLEVSGLVERPLRLSLRELHNMRSETLVATLECAGNGRSAFDPPAEGEQWQFGAVSTAEWTGVPLAEILDRAGLRPEAREIVFRGADQGDVGDPAGPVRFERSLPVTDAGHSGSLLAYAMNGEPLPLEHGYPMRLIVPGWYAVASVKWLTEIDVIGAPFTGFFQTERYIYETEHDGTVAREPVRLQQVRSVITQPSAGQEVPAGDLVVRGVAWSGAAPIDKVEVSIGTGPWQNARLIGQRHRHSWQWWELLTRIDSPGQTTLRARATDLAGRTQPDRPQWNRLGYGGNAVQNIPLLVLFLKAPTTELGIEHATASRDARSGPPE
jgi:DMSO/TMAO reductase YedYZ molybdopterin-dependent catalytic subunit